MVKFVIGAIFIGCLAGCQTRYSCPKERSYLTAMRILQTGGEEAVVNNIKACNDIDALRIIAFTATTTAWPMEAGSNVDFDNKMEGIFFIAMQRLFDMDSEEANESIECYKQAFPPDGAYSLFFKECEEKRNALHSKQNSASSQSESALISPQALQP